MNHLQLSRRLNVSRLTTRLFVLSSLAFVLSASGCCLWDCGASNVPCSYCCPNGSCPLSVAEPQSKPKELGAKGVNQAADNMTSVEYRGQINQGLNEQEAFPTLDETFPSLNESPLAVEDPLTPPETSELSNFVATGTDVPEPSGTIEESNFSEETFRPQPKRESLAEREKAEQKVEENFEVWLAKQKAKRKENSKTPRFLQPIPDNKLDGETDLYSRDNKDSESSMVRTVTAEGLELLMENETTQRDLYDWEKDEPTPVDWSKYALSVDRIRSWFGMGPNERAALEYMRQACLKQKEYYKSKDPKCLKEAATLYEKAASRWPGPALRPESAAKNPFSAPKSGTLIEEDGLFFAGECWFFYKDYNKALTCFKALVQTYTSSIYKETAMKRLFYIGTYWVKCSEEATTPSVNVKDKDKPTFSTFKGAEKAFTAIFLNDASENGLAPEALFSLANAFMRRGVKQGDGSFDRAAQYYKQLYEFYPTSKRAEDACRLAMIALHRSYQGAFYDAGPLDEAGRLAETILKSGRGNMDVVYEELENIKEEQAARLYALGQYYEKRGNFASARSFYNRLVKEYPNSNYATESAQAYEKIESKPAEADQFSWVRPVAPFLPKPNKEYFEEVPEANLSKIAQRDETLDKIGQNQDETQDKESNVSEDAKEEIFPKTAETETDANRR